MQSRLVLLIVTAALTISGCTNTQPTSPSAEQAIAQTLDQLHQRASAADFAGYFDLYAEDAVFLGTDKNEYWPLAEFKAYTQPHFSRGNGWTYAPIERMVHLNGATAWFEERLRNEKYGEVRGTGVLINTSKGWKVAQYNLTLPLPNELFGEIALDVSRFYRHELEAPQE